MIIGFSHLIFNTLQVEEVISDLVNKGYSLDFSEIGLPNHPYKKRLLGDYNETHDIHLLRHKDNYDVEIINHYSSSKTVQDRLHLDGDKIVTVTIPNDKRAIETEFWTSLGLKVNRGGVYLKRPVPAWDIEIQFVESSASLTKQTLDLSGFTSIAFITKNIKRCKELVSDKTSWVSETFSLEVNGNSLSIALMKSPTGVIIELIEI